MTNEHQQKIARATKQCQDHPRHHFSTQSIHAGVRPDPVTGALLTPIYQTTTYTQEAVGQDKGYTYTRTGNPTVSVLEKKLGELEGVEVAACFSSGMAAITALFLAYLRSGDHIICADVVYGGTVRLLEEVLKPFGINASYVDTTDLNAVQQAITAQTRFILIETPANPTLKLTDIHALATLAHDANLLLVVDNTFLTAALQKPFQLGADVVIYSTTKYIEGNNATVGGALLANDAKLMEQIRFVQNAVGFAQSPFEAWLTLQGIKTLSLRIHQHSENALVVARFLEAHPQISQVYYPGLASFGQYELAQRQQLASGGLLAFEVMGGLEAGIKLMNSVRLCALAENLGAAETLITHPASMTHDPIPAAQRVAVGITDSLVRLSVGLEDPKDVIADLEQALLAVSNEKEA